MRRTILLSLTVLVIAVALTLLLRFGADRNWQDAIEIAALTLGVVLFVIACIAVFPGLLIRHSGLDGAERVKAENDARGTLLQAIAGVALLAGAYVTWSQLAATQKQVSIATRQQVNDQFSRAIEQLGNKTSRSVRIGGIYSLARLAEIAKEERYPVLDILSSYVREHARLTPGKPKDAATLGTLRLRAPDVHIAIIQMSVLNTDPEVTPPLDHSQLAGVELSGLRLSRFVFSGSDLRNAQFFNAKMDHAFFDEADLRGAEFGPGDDLSGAFFIRTNLAGARIYIVKGTTLGTNLQGAVLEDVNVCGANLIGANLNAVRPGMRLYVDHKTRWPTDFDLSKAKERGEVRFVTPDVRKELSGNNFAVPLEGCA